MKLSLAPLALGSLLLACAASSTPDDTASSDEAITGSLGDTRACVVVNAYRAAKPEAFEYLERSDVPFATSADVTLAARFDVSGAGKVYVIETKASGGFYTPGGMPIAKRVGTTFAGPSGETLPCGSGGDDPTPAALSIAKVTPNRVQVGQSTIVIITGTGFAPNTAVSADGSSLPMTFVSPTTLKLQIHPQVIRDIELSVDRPGAPSVKAILHVE